MKKILSTLVVLFTASLTFAYKLPTGQETVIRESKEENGKVTAVVLGAPVVFNTSIGDVTAKANTRCDFYESGALKFCYSDDTKDVTLKAGTFKLTTFHSTRPGTGEPFEFYENGKLKSAHLSRQGKPFVETPIGKLQAMTATKVTFFEDGRVESFAVYPNQKIAFKNLTGQYVQSRILSFYENGSVKALTSNAEETYQPLGIKTKKATEIKFSESGSMISFTPADNSVVKIGEFMFLLCRDKDFELYENGSIKKCTIECSKQDFTVGLPVFAYKTVTETFESQLPFVPTAYLTLEFSEIGQLLSATADKTGVHGLAFPIVGGIGERLWSAKSLEFFDDGKLRSIDYVKAVRIGNRLRPDYFTDNANPEGYANVNVSVAPAVKIKKANTTYEIWKSYFSNDGATEYLVGREVTESPKSSIYDEAVRGIFVLRNGQIAESIYLEDITGTSNLVFDEGGKLVSYTVTAGDDDSVITKQIKR